MKEPKAKVKNIRVEIETQKKKDKHVLLSEKEIRKEKRKCVIPTKKNRMMLLKTRQKCRFGH